MEEILEVDNFLSSCGKPQTFVNSRLKKLHGLKISITFVFLLQIEGFFTSDYKLETFLEQPPFE